MQYNRDHIYDVICTLTCVCWQCGKPLVQFVGGDINWFALNPAHRLRTLAELSTRITSCRKCQQLNCIYIVHANAGNVFRIPRFWDPVAARVVEGDGIHIPVEECAQRIRYISPRVRHFIGLQRGLEELFIDVDHNMQ